MECINREGTFARDEQWKKSNKFVGNFITMADTANALGGLNALQYKPKNVAEMQATLKEVFGPMFETMLNGEMESYLGYENNSREEKETTNRRNGYFDKTIKTSMGETEIAVPRDSQTSKLAAWNSSGSAKFGQNIPARLPSGKGVSPMLNNFLITRRRGAKLCTRPMPFRRLIPISAR